MLEIFELLSPEERKISDFVIMEIMGPINVQNVKFESLDELLYKLKKLNNNKEFREAREKMEKVFFEVFNKNNIDAKTLLSQFSVIDKGYKNALSERDLKNKISHSKGLLHLEIFINHYDKLEDSKAIWLNFTLNGKLYDIRNIHSMEDNGEHIVKVDINE